RIPRSGVGYRPLLLATADGRAVPVQVLDRRVTSERLDALRHYPDHDEVDQVRIAVRTPPLAGLGLATVTIATGATAPGTRPSGESGRVEGRSLVKHWIVVAREPWGGRVLDGRRGGMLHAAGPLIRCILEIENQAGWHRLRARLPTGLAGTTALAGTAFGAVARTPVAAPSAAYPLETPVRTAPAHRFVAAASGPRGLALLAPEFFEYEWTPDGDLLFTLLRSVGELSRGDLPTRPGHAGWPTATP